MSWDDEDDAFFAQIDVDSAVQQARARQQPQQQQPQPRGPGGQPALPPQHPPPSSGVPGVQQHPVPLARPGPVPKQRVPSYGRGLLQQAAVHGRPGLQQHAPAQQRQQQPAVPAPPGQPQHTHAAAAQPYQQRPAHPQVQRGQPKGGPAATGLRALFATGAEVDDDGQAGGPQRGAPGPPAQAHAAGQWQQQQHQQQLQQRQPPPQAGGQWPQQQRPLPQQPGGYGLQLQHQHGWPASSSGQTQDVQRLQQQHLHQQHGQPPFGQQQVRVHQPPPAHQHPQLQQPPGVQQQQPQQQQQAYGQQQGPCGGNQHQQHPSVGYQQHPQHPQGGYQQQQQHPSGGAGSGRQGHASGPASGAGQAAASLGHGLGPLLYVNLELGRDHMVEVKCGYREVVAEALKRIPGGLWDARHRFWKFPLSQHGRVVEVLQSLHDKSVRIQLQDLPPIVCEVLKAATACPDDSERYCHIPAALEQQLMPFQREGIKFALKHGGRALIGDEMGLGKTVQAIALASAYRDEWPVLVVAPSSLREAWADALHRWLGITADRMHIVHSGKDAQNVPRSAEFLIVSYNFVQKMDLNKRFGMIICDESHYLKEGGSQRTKATVPLVKAIRRAILLSGTPALNKPKEIFQQLAALVPKARIKMTQFGERYCQGNRFDKYGGASNLPELNALLINSVMVRRLKSEVLTQLPRKRRQQVMLDLEPDAKKQLAGLQKQLEIVRQVMGQEARQGAASGGAAGGGGAARAEQNAVITQLYNKTAEVKAKAVQDYVTMLLENSQKFLVFGHHTCMLDAIEHACNRFKSGKKGIKYIRIDGTTPASKRQSLVNDFQQNEDYRVAVLSIRAAGTGLTLTAASTVVFAEMTWVPGETIQAEDRAHRIGQASSVNVYFLHARGSIDDLIWQSIQNKLDSVGEAIDGEAQALDARRVEALERGQMTLAPFMTQAPTPAQQQQQQQGGAAGAAGQSGPGGGGGAGAAPRSPAKTHQSSLLNFLAGGSRQQGGGQGRAPPHPPPAQQQQQQQQHWQAHPPPAQQQRPGENSWQQARQQPAPGAVPPPLHGPSGLANVQRGPAGPPRAAGVKRPFEGSD